jgi:hypothetical protein
MAFGLSLSGRKSPCAGFRASQTRQRAVCLDYIALSRQRAKRPTTLGQASMGAVFNKAVVCLRRLAVRCGRSMR